MPAGWVGRDHKSIGLPSIFDPERLAPSALAPLEESHEDSLPTDDTHRAGWGQRDLDGRIRFCLANDDLVVDAHCAYREVYHHSDYAEAAVLLGMPATPLRPLCCGPLILG